MKRLNNMAVASRQSAKVILSGVLVCFLALPPAGALGGAQERGSGNNGGPGMVPQEEQRMPPGAGGPRMMPGQGGARMMPGQGGGQGVREPVDGMEEGQGRMVPPGNGGNGRRVGPPPGAVGPGGREVRKNYPPGRPDIRERRDPISERPRPVPHREGERRVRHSKINIGTFFPLLPPEIVALQVAGALFFYHSGLFYKRAQGGYVVAEAPIGARVSVIPKECEIYYGARGRYYYCNDIYYRPIGDYYEVVQPPADISSRFEVVVGDEVRITTDVLNVRSGPGVRFSVLNQLYRNDVVTVADIDGPWYFINFQDGAGGWILGEYATFYRSEPKG